MSRRPRGHLGDAAVQTELKKIDHKLDGLEIRDLQELMKGAAGRRLYYRIVFELCGIESTSYANSGQYMAFLEGRRSIGIKLLQEAQQHCPEAWPRMVAERIAEKAVAQQVKEKVINSTQGANR